jgi:murein DD-endopeptidase MepM/ murein hydrolase activator NlpD
MARERWTLLLMRGKDCPVRQYSISVRAIHFAVGGLVFAMTSVSGLGLAVGLGGAARLEAVRLEEQNAALTSTLGRLRGRVEGLELTIESLAERDAQVRLLAGLDAIGEEVLAVGVGGPGLSLSPESNPLYALDETLGKTAFAVTYDLNALERRARLLGESLSEANETLVMHTDLLRATPSILPTGGILTSRFSSSRPHPILNRALPHEGIDISAPRGAAILAAANGKVVQAGNFAGYGMMVEIDHGFGFTTRYGHASRLLVRAGQTVERGDVIAHVGSTGIATGPHLHYEVRINGVPQNPMNYVLPDAVP